MQDELFGIGRGYLLGFLTLGSATAMVFTGHIGAEQWLGFSQWLVPLVVAAKESGKVLTKVTGGTDGGKK